MLRFQFLFFAPLAVGATCLAWFAADTARRCLLSRYSVLSVGLWVFKTQSASSASIIATVNGQKKPLRTILDLETYEFIHETRAADVPNVIEGRVSSYNSNTYKGRIYVAKYGRPVAFEIAQPARSQRTVRLITTSLRHNALKQYSEAGAAVHCVAFENTSKSGHLKSLTLTKVSDAPLSGA